MSFSLPKLPYAQDALAPHISAKTLEFHHGKHHQTYVDNLNKLVEGKPQANKSLEELIRESAGKEAGLFNNAGQVWNHTFFWESMKPGGGGEPKGEVASAIQGAFGSFADFRKNFLAAGTGQFGSGWAWLVIDNGKLAINSTANADCPLTRNQVPLLTCDVWEHAYYLDYQNRRAGFLEAFVDHLVNWDAVAERLAKSKK